MTGKARGKEEEELFLFNQVLTIVLYLYVHV